MALEETKTPKLNLKKSLISSSVFSGASIAPKVSFGGLAKAIGSQPSFLDTPKLDVPKANPLADIVSQLQVKFESLSSTVRSNIRKITLLKRVLDQEDARSFSLELTEKGELSALELMQIFELKEKNIEKRMGKIQLEELVEILERFKEDYALNSLENVQK